MKSSREPPLLFPAPRKARASMDDCPRCAVALRPIESEGGKTIGWQCPTCLSPCQMNVAAIKQVVPYARFLVRAAREKRRFRHGGTLAPESAAAR